MSRLQTIEPSTATGKAKESLDGVNAKLGFVPNMTMANSPAALQGYFNLRAALAGGVLNAKVREQIALLTAEQNHCDYCLSAHTAIGKMVGLNPEQTIASRKGDGGSMKVTSTLKFARRVVESKGQIAEADLADARGGLVGCGDHRSDFQCRSECAHQLLQRRDGRSHRLPEGNLFRRGLIMPEFKTLRVNDLLRPHRPLAASSFER
jgi:AhpD family alkylhydroperoxidase